MTNKLSFEKSPYLLQHAANPVDWQPWGKKAFDQAKAEDKPIFLSIGYSTCHCLTSKINLRLVFDICRKLFIDKNKASTAYPP